MSLCVQELCHPQDSVWILATIRVCRNDTSLTVLDRESHFYLVSGFWLVYSKNSSDVSEEYGSPRTCLSTLSLDTIAGGWSISFEGVVSVEVDEFEEDLGWSISCLKGVMYVEVGKLEEQLAENPGTTIGTKFSVLHCIRKPFLVRCGFLTSDPLPWVSVVIAKLS